MTKFNRIAKVEVRLRSLDNAFIGKVDITNLRIAFQVNKTLSWGTNTSSVQIYNMNQDKRNKIKNFGDEVSLFAGYKEDTGLNLVFIGDTTKVSHMHDFPNVISDFVSGEGERILNFQRILISFSEGTPARKVLRGIAQRLGVTISYFPNTPNLVYKKGFQANDMAKNVLDKVCKYLGLSWSIQNKSLQLLEDREGTTDEPPVVFSQNTGLIGVPQRFSYRMRSLYAIGPREGWKAKTLLRPDVLPGSKVRLISEKTSTDELLLVRSVKHTGDTHGQPWESEWELSRILV